LKILSVLAVLLIVGLPVIAAETVSALAPAVQDSATLPPDSSPFTPDSPEKQKRVKKLLNQITATYGITFAREIPMPTWQPRIKQLYKLHKKLTDSDWKLLAEMYIAFYNKNYNFPAKALFDDSENITKLESAAIILLGMHGEPSIDIFNSIIKNIDWTPEYKKLWVRVRLGEIKRLIELKPWSNLSEYKEDQQRNNK
jgi:hypothetical protein